MAAKKKKTRPTASPGIPGARPLQLDLEAVRARIDTVDEQIHTLINERARLAQQVGISKAASGRTVDFYRPEREAQVLRTARARNEGPLRDAEVLRLFREIMSACLAQQEPLKVAFLGPEGTFTQTAVLTHFGHSVRALPLDSIDEVFHEVEAANADFGVVPIENSTEGTVNHTLDRFLSSPLKICGEVELRIHQHLMGLMSSLRRHQAHLLASAVAGAVPQLARLSTCRASSRSPARATRKGARRARDEKGTCRDRRGDRRRGLWPEGAGGGDRGPGRQHHALPGAGAQGVRAQRRGPHHAAGVGGTYRFSGRARPAARAARPPRRQHDPHRVAPLAPAQVGLRVLHRLRGPRRGSARWPRRWRH